MHIQLKPDARPRFIKARPVPYAIKDEIGREFDRLVEQGVYQPISHSDWAAPIVPVTKLDGSIRICGDYKQTVNQAAVCDHCPLPKIEDLLATLNGGQKFTKLDLSQAYQQLVLDDESQRLLTKNTHKGLYKPTCLQFGVHSASGMFQREIEKRLSHIPHTVCRVDDILITGATDENHLSNLREVLRVLSEAGLRLKKSKCHFLAPQVTYCGFAVSREGVAPISDKVEAIVNAPAPRDVSQVKFFLRMINYYHRHLPNLANCLEPLHELLRNNRTWNWGKPQQTAFDAAKTLLSSANLLVHYNPNRELILSCDASPYGIGAVLSHIMDDNTERPVAFASRTMSPKEITPKLRRNG